MKKKAVIIPIFFGFYGAGETSPFFGKDKAATFERYFIDETEPHKEHKNSYYKLIDKEETCNFIFKEFGLDEKESHIINGHIPVKAKSGENPLKANGKLLVIDGGFAKSYQKETGEAGYTLTYNSYGLLLVANKPFCSKQDAIQKEYDLQSEIVVKDTIVERKMVSDTDIGKKLQAEIDDLKMLLRAYREGFIKEKGQRG